jgi:hypothetical protein
MRGSASVGLVVCVLAAGCASASNQNLLCPGQSSDFAVRVDTSAVKLGTVLRLCADRPAGCVVRQLTDSGHRHYVFVGYSYRGASAIANIRLTLRASRDGHVRSDAVLLRIPQRQFGRCGDYGGPGYAVINSDGKLIASHLGGVWRVDHVRTRPSRHGLATGPGSHRAKWP